MFAPLIDERPRPCRPHNGYERAWELRRAGCTVGRVMVGERFEWPHVTASGEDAPDLADLLRSEKIPHAVARVDACADVDAPGTFEHFERTLLEVLPARITRTQYKQTKNGQPASTLYLGSRKSESFARVYEKGKESPDRYSPDTVRLEVQSRPSGPDRKQWAASATPHEVMSLPKWSGEMLGLVQLDRLPTPVRAERVSDLDGALEAMGRQYGRRVRELAARHGGDLDAVSADLLRVFGLAAAPVKSV